MITIEPYKPSWAGEFIDIGKDIRAALGKHPKAARPAVSNAARAYKRSMRFTVAGDTTVEEALRQKLREEDLDLVNLEGDGDLYAWYASNNSNEQLKGIMRRTGEGEFEMEMTPLLNEVADH